MALCTKPQVLHLQIQPTVDKKKIGEGKLPNSSKKQNLNLSRAEYYTESTQMM